MKQQLELRREETRDIHQYVTTKLTALLYLLAPQEM